MTDEIKKDITQEELRMALSAMHRGLVTMQARLDDHEKVLEKMMVVFDNLATAQVPNGFRQPKAN